MNPLLSTKIKEEDGKVVISRSQDVQSILDYNKEKQIAGTVSGGEMRHVGQVPFVVVEAWLRESGLKLGSQEFAGYVKKKLMSNEFSKLIVHGY